MQMLSGLLERSSEVFHNVKTATRTYVELESFQKALNKGKAKDLSVYTHEMRWVKSPAEINLMREAATIACQVTLHESIHQVLRTYLRARLPLWLCH